MSLITPHSLVSNCLFNDENIYIYKLGGWEVVVICVFTKNIKLLLSEVGFEPTPTEVDCDLNAAP